MTTYNQSAEFLPWLTPMASELSERLLLAELATGQKPPVGSFVSKRIKGRVYWYIQWSDGTRQRQLYFGPDNEVETARREQMQQNWHNGKVAAHARSQLCQLVRAGQVLPPPSAPTSRLLVALHNAGLHRSGAVLIGTFAFLAYQGLLGVKWPAQVAETQDVDVASEPDVWLIAPEKMQLWPLLQHFGLAPTAPIDQLEATTFISPRADMRVDVIAPLRGRKHTTPIDLQHLGVHGAPLRFIDHLIGDPILLSLPLADGVLAVVPQPARFALHKLILAAYRRREDKRRKDLLQADLLLLLLAQSQPAVLREAFAALPKSWRNKVVRALVGLRPEVRLAVDGLFEG